jgi:uncharacterized OsmC-like protein
MRVRDFELIADEPVKLGGTDAGPMPTELFLSSLAACFAMSVAHVARKRGVELPDLTVRAHGEYEGLRFSRIRVEVQSSHPRDELDAFIRRAISYCYVSNTLRQKSEIEYVAAEAPGVGDAGGHGAGDPGGPSAGNARRLITHPSPPPRD